MPNRWPATFLAIVLAVILPLSGAAQVPPLPSRTLAELMALFPSSAQLPVGMILADEGSRSAADIAASFPDPADAADVLATWGWAVNAYRVYEAGPGAGPETPTRLEVSLHQFSSNTGAAFALPYFAHGRAVLLGQEEPSAWLLRPCEGGTTDAYEGTRYLRYGDLLIRVTARASELPPDRAYFVALGTATDMAFTVLGNAGGSLAELDRTCQ